MSNRVSIERLICEINDIISSRDLDLADKDVEFNDLGLDSLDQAQILISLQDIYKFEVAEGEEDGLTTINKIFEFLSCKIQLKNIYWITDFSSKNGKFDDTGPKNPLL